jgi:hypothetical protein
MPAITEKQPDPKRIVISLAAECHVPVAEMALLYEHQRAVLALEAHNTQYLHIFATRNVLDMLHQRELDHPAGQQMSLLCPPPDAS